MAKATSLQKAYVNGAIPLNGGFIFSSSFDPATAYAIYEITSYAGVEDIKKYPEGLVFKTDGNRTHVLLEPPSYPGRHLEPLSREKERAIPYCFSEIDIIECKKSERLMVPREPVNLRSSFTIRESAGGNFCFIFYPTEDVYAAIKKFMADLLYNDCNLSKDESVNGAGLLMNTIKKFSVWKR